MFRYQCLIPYNDEQQVVGVGPLSVAVRQTGRCAAKPRGGSISPLEKHADFLLGLIEKQPDLTLDEVVLAMRKHKNPGGRTAVWRFFKRHKITFEKSLRAAEQERADVARARRRWMALKRYRSEAIKPWSSTSR